MNIDRFNSFVKDNSPTILSAAAVAGVITTAVLAARAAVKASAEVALAEQLKWDKARDSDPDFVETDNVGLTARERVETCWKFFVPTAATGGATIACIVWSNRIGLKRNAALLAAYAIAEGAFREYKDQVIEQFGKKEHAKVQDAVAERRIKENPPPSPTVVLAGGGDQLCYDMYTGRYFRCDIETIRQAVNLINTAIIQGDMYASLNEFYGFLGLDSVGVGEAVGWNVDNQCDVSFSSHLAEDGRVALAISFAHLPKADFGKCF